jgi:polar amino acid transport system ATP-binding protein
MIAIEGLVKRRAERVVLGGVTVRFAEGVTCVVGPSGGGKSTLLRCIDGLEDFDAGLVRVGDTTLGPGPEAMQRAERLAVRRRVGFVFQHFHLFSHRTALGNVVEAPMVVGGLSRRDAETRAMALLEKVGVAHRANALPHELSGGEQQRVAIARALAMNPEALLLDEPTSALDPERKEDVLALLRTLACEGTTMIVVTHEIAFARELADEVVVLDGGAIVDRGPAASVLASRLS